MLYPWYIYNGNTYDKIYSTLASKWDPIILVAARNFRNSHLLVNNLQRTRIPILMFWSVWVLKTVSFDKNYAHFQSFYIFFLEIFQFARE